MSELSSGSNDSNAHKKPEWGSDPAGALDPKKAEKRKLMGEAVRGGALISGRGRGRGRGGGRDVRGGYGGGGGWIAGRVEGGMEEETTGLGFATGGGGRGEMEEEKTKLGFATGGGGGGGRRGWVSGGLEGATDDAMQRPTGVGGAHSGHLTVAFQCRKLL